MEADELITEGLLQLTERPILRVTGSSPLVAPLSINDFGAGVGQERGSDWVGLG